VSKYLRSAGLVALSFAAACAVSTAASAQEYDRLVVFGDSLSDNGNLFNATGGVAPAAPFVDGRFSTGPVFTELLGFNAGRFTEGAPVTGSVNYAFGGSRTDAIASPGPGMQTQLGAYLGAGGQFDSSDLVSVLGGANNIFQGIAAAGASPNPVAAIDGLGRSAATDIVGIVNTIAGAGAGTVLVTNLPKLSLTPAFSGTPGAALADRGVTTFNTALAAGLAQVSANNAGANIITMDLFKIGDTLAGDPDAFGIGNVTDSCFATAPAACNSGNYFYTDGVHPTALGHRLIARLANDYLYYADIGAASALQGETAYRHREDSLDMATESLSGRAPWAAGTTLAVSATIDKTDTDARGAVGDASSESYGVQIALESGPSENWRFGALGSFRQDEVKSGLLNFDVNTMSIDIYGGWRSGGMFVTAAAGLANNNFDDIERLTSLAPLVHTAETKGTSSGFRLQAGYWFEAGGFAISPRVGLTSASSDVDGYYEQGTAAQYQYQDRTVEALTGEVALRIEGDMGGWGVFAEGGYRDNLDDSSDAVGVGIYGNSARVLYREVEDPFGGQFLASLGLEGDLGPVKVSVGYRGRFGDHADSHMGAIRFALPL